MRSYFVEVGTKVSEGGLLHCIARAGASIDAGSPIVARVYSARAGERHARVIGEVTEFGFSFCRSGRLVPIRSLRMRR